MKNAGEREGSISRTEGCHHHLQRCVQEVPGGLVGDISGAAYSCSPNRCSTKNAYVTMKLNTSTSSASRCTSRGWSCAVNDRGMAIQFTYANDDDLSSLLSF
jgi:hypothetical protein